PPEPAAILPDRAIRRETANAGTVENRHARPALRVAICMAHAFLTLNIGRIVGKEHVLVAAQQRVHERSEKLTVAIREMPGSDEVDCLAQLLIRLINAARPVAVRSQLYNLLRGQTEQEKILMPDRVADLDVCAVQRSDGERAVH